MNAKNINDDVLIAMITLNGIVESIGRLAVMLPEDDEIQLDLLSSILSLPKPSQLLKAFRISDIEES